jgi:hypothetical protein
MSAFGRRADVSHGVFYEYTPQQPMIFFWKRYWPASSQLVVEDYPSSRKEPSVLVLQRDGSGLPVHVMWGVPKIKGTPAVLVTAYRPTPELWSSDFMNRKKP